MEGKSGNCTQSQEAESGPGSSSSCRMTLVALSVPGPQAPTYGRGAGPGVLPPAVPNWASFAGWAVDD